MLTSHVAKKISYLLASTKAKKNAAEEKLVVKGKGGSVRGSIDVEEK